MINLPRKFLLPLAAIAALGLAGWLYSFGLGGAFVFDDEPNITMNSRLTVDSLDSESLWRAAMSGQSGPIRRPLSMVSFALNYYTTGKNPFYFKITNLAMHLLGAVGLGILGYLLIGATRPAISREARGWIAMAAAGAWALHPIHLTSILYVVQRMTSLASLWMIWGIVFYVLGRMHQQQGRSGWVWILGGIAGFGLLAILSKETGALLPLYLLTVEWCIFRFATPDSRDRRYLQILFGITVALPIALVALILAIEPEALLAAYGIRDYTLDERLLTEGRVLVWYLRQILLPDITQMGLFLDDFEISRLLTDPWTTLPALLVIGGLIGLAIFARYRWPLLAMGIFWFFVGHSLESTFLPLEIAFEHRNYLPAYGILLATSYHLLQPNLRGQRLRTGVAIAWLALIAIGLHSRSVQWSNETQWALTEVEYHPRSPRSQYIAGVQYEELAARQPERRDEYFDLARSHFGESVRLNPRMANIWIATIALYQRNEQPIPPDLFDRTAQALRTTSFLASHVNAVRNLTQCIIDRVCTLTEREYQRLIFAALENPTLTGSHRANVLMYASHYLAFVRGDFERALELVDRAIAIQPTGLAYRLARLKWLLYARDHASARAEIARISELDRYRLYDKEIRELESGIPELRRKHDATP